MVNDQVIYVINENYREPNKPYFERVAIKGGGDAVSAARAVMQTGDYDFAWNLQVEPDLASSRHRDGKPGRIATSARPRRSSGSTSSSRIPTRKSNGQRAEINTPHPIPDRPGGSPGDEPRPSTGS